MAFRRWIWVEDTSTGHRYDLDERSLPRLLAEDAVRIVPGYPPNEGSDVRPRPAKPRLDLAEVAAAKPPAKSTARRARRTTPAPAAQPAEPTTTAEGAE